MWWCVNRRRPLHPGLPAYLPGNKKPEDKNHAIAFQDRADAERFCWFMRSTRAEGEGICTTQPMPPATMEKIAKELGRLGVTVVGSGRVNLDAGRRDMDVLQDIREIGGGNDVTTRSFLSFCFL